MTTLSLVPEEIRKSSVPQFSFWWLYRARASHLFSPRQHPQQDPTCIRIIHVPLKHTFPQASKSGLWRRDPGVCLWNQMVGDWCAPHSQIPTCLGDSLWMLGFTLFQTLDSTMPTTPPPDLRVQPYSFFKTHFNGPSLELSAKSPPSVTQQESTSHYH